MDPFVLIRQLQGMFGGATGGVRFGTKDVPLVAAVAGTATVTHGLGKTPSAVTVTARDSTGLVNATVSNRNSATFDVTACRVDGAAVTATYSLDWHAIG